MVTGVVGLKVGLLHVDLIGTAPEVDYFDP